MTRARSTRAADDMQAETDADEIADDQGLRSLQRRAGNRAVGRLLGEGRPLEPETRDVAERLLRSDFADVRVHTTGPAAEQARALDADAFALGADIAFAPGHFDPSTAKGRQLLLHELTHVAQQRAPGEAPGETLEAEAETTAAAAIRGERRAPAGRGGVRVQQQPQPAPEPPDLATWYQQAAAFSAGVDVLGTVVARIRDMVIDEYDEWYVVTDRTFTRPVVDRVLNDARAFAARVKAFIAESPQDEPLLGQLREDLARFEQIIYSLEQHRPSDIGFFERTGRRFVGGVKGATKSVGGFFRLGLWDSWAQSFSGSSRRRILDAQKGMGQMFDDVGEKGVGGTVRQYGSDWADRLYRAEMDQQHIAAGEQFGATAFDIYFAGRGLVSIARGVSQVSKAATAFRALGNPAPWRAAAMVGLREAATFRGVGMYGPRVQSMLPRFTGSQLLGSSYGIPQTGTTVPVIRVIDSQQDLVAKLFREPNSLILDKSGQFRPLGDVARSHVRTSTGSPLQSGYPWGDLETVATAIPQNIGVATRPYYVVLEVPRGQTLVDVNTLEAVRAGLDPAKFPEFGINRYGMQLPQELRPGPGGSFYDLSVEAQAWHQANVAFTKGSPVAKAFSKTGVPYYEWEQVMLAPDLGPYVTEVRPNPFWTGGPRGPLPAQVQRPPIYDPAVNPQTLYGLGTSGAQGWPRVQNYFDWLASQSEAGALGFTSPQLTGSRALTFLGGSPTTIGGAPLWDMEPEYYPEPSEAALQGYLEWIGSTAQPPGRLVGTALASLATTGTKSLSANYAGEASQKMARLATVVRSKGATVSSFRVGPDIATIELSVLDADGLDEILREIVWSARSVSSSVGVGVRITLLTQPESIGPGPAQLDVKALLEELNAPDNLALTISATGDRWPLFTR